MSDGTLEMLLKTYTALDEELSVLEVRQKAIESLLRGIERDAIPDYFAQQGLSYDSELVVGDKRVRVKKDVRGHINADDMKAAYEWLQRTDNDGILTVAVKVQFNRGELQKAIAFKELLEDELIDMLSNQPVVEMRVHPMTLNAFLKEQLEHGKDLPEFFNAQDSFCAKISQTKVR